MGIKVLYIQSMYFLWLSLHQWTYSDFLEILKNPLKKTLVFTPNPEILMKAHGDFEFLEILKQADFLTPDANGLYTASLMQDGMGFFRAGLMTLFVKKSLREKYGELIQWSNLTRDLVSFSLQEQKNILMIDNYRITDPENEFEVKKMQIQSKLSELFQEKFPELSIHILFDGEKTPQAIAEIIQQENISYVFSCIGMKTQEKRLIEIFDVLPEDQKVVGLGVGSSFDYLLGLQIRAPLFFQKLGLESQALVFGNKIRDEAQAIADRSSVLVHLQI